MTIDGRFLLALWGLGALVVIYKLHRANRNVNNLIDEALDEHYPNVRVIIPDDISTLYRHPSPPGGQNHDDR